jgi:hypothetical protein
VPEQVIESCAHFSLFFSRVVFSLRLCICCICSELMPSTGDGKLLLRRDECFIRFHVQAAFVSGINFFPALQMQTMGATSPQQPFATSEEQGKRARLFSKSRALVFIFRAKSIFFSISTGGTCAHTHIPADVHVRLLNSANTIAAARRSKGISTAFLAFYFPGAHLEKYKNICSPMSHVINFNKTLPLH